MITRYIELISQALGTLNQGSLAALVALFLLLALGEFGIPFPFVLQGVLFYMGYQLLQGKVQVIPLVLILISGRLFGSAILYWLARFLGTPFTNWFEKRFHLVGHQLDKLKGSLGVQVPLAVAVGRLIGLLVPTSLASGAFGLRYGYFALGIALSAAIWDGTFIASGAALKALNWHLNLSTSPWLVASGFAAVVCLVWVAGRLLKQRQAKREQR